MKTQVMHWQNTPDIKRYFGLPVLHKPAVPVSMPLHALAALLPAVLIPVLTIWATEAGALEYAAASYWSGGFIFLALAFETNGLRKKLLLGSGFAAMALAWAASRLAPEFLLMAAMLPTAWFAGPFFSHLLTTGGQNKTPTGQQPDSDG